MLFSAIQRKLNLGISINQCTFPIVDWKFLDCFLQGIIRHDYQHKQILVYEELFFTMRTKCSKYFFSPV